MKKLLAVILLGGSSLLGQVSMGIRIGPPPPARVLRNRPRNPGNGYVWVDGYWYASKNRYVWHNGYYTRPPFPGATWVGPRYEGGMFLEGYWSGNERQFNHDHRWDRDGHNRDYDRDRDGRR
ncbi:MAG: hypothetical protein ABI811_13365 [Acidobacteriota bacterium]